VAIVGAYECWPRSRRFPRPGRVRLEFGRVTTPAEVAAVDDATLTAALTAQLHELDAAARAARAGRPFTAPPARPPATAASAPA
jgi:hypothetical protein